VYPLDDQGHTSGVAGLAISDRPKNKCPPTSFYKPSAPRALVYVKFVNAIAMPSCRARGVKKMSSPAGVPLPVRDPLSAGHKTSHRAEASKP
jgi:hypothetical protein